MVNKVYLINRLRCYDFILIVVFIIVRFAAFINYIYISINNTTIIFISNIYKVY